MWARTDKVPDLKSGSGFFSRWEYIEVKSVMNIRSKSGTEALRIVGVASGAFAQAGFDVMEKSCGSESEAIHGMRASAN